MEVVVADDDTCSAFIFFDRGSVDIDNGGIDWNSFSGVVLSDAGNEKSAESPRTLSRSLRKCDVDDEESWLTPECVAAGGIFPEEDDAAVDDFSTSRVPLLLTGDRLKMGW